MINVGFMRWIDNRVGNLACSALALQKRVFGPTTPPTAPYRKIAVMKFFGLGSIIVSSPALAALRDLYPDAEIHFVTFQSNKGVLELLGVADKHWFIDVSSPAALAKTTLLVTAALRRENIDLVVDLEFFAKFPMTLSGLAGIPHKAGFYLTPETWRRTLLDVAGSYNHYFHTKDIFLSLVYLLHTGDFYYLDFEAFRAKYKYPHLTPSQESRVSLAKVLAETGVDTSGSLIVINANTSPDLAPEVRKWPEERYAELAKRLLAEYPSATVCFIGANNERTYVESICRRVADPRAFSLAGKTNLKELLALFARASLVISNDSGPMHLACLVDAPILGLFFADTPTIFGPIATRTETVTPGLYSIPLFTVYNGKDVVAGKPVDGISNRAARAVSVETVLEKARELLGEPAALTPHAAALH
ncbi:MAG: glycosyltransferase family 9 protein [Polyangiaceae bacterium]